MFRTAIDNWNLRLIYLWLNRNFFLHFSNQIIFDSLYFWHEIVSLAWFHVLSSCEIIAFFSVYFVTFVVCFSLVLLSRRAQNTLGERLNVRKDGIVAKLRTILLNPRLVSGFFLQTKNQKTINYRNYCQTLIFQFLIWFFSITLEILKRKRRIFHSFLRSAERLSHKTVVNCLWSQRVEKAKRLFTAFPSRKLSRFFTVRERKNHF